MKTREFNLQNWTGETAVVSYTKAGKFSFYDYDFQVKLKYDGDWTHCELVSGQWSEPLASFVSSFTYDGVVTLEDWVIRAVRYIANHV